MIESSRNPRKTAAADMESRTTPKTGCALHAPRKEIFCLFFERGFVDEIQRVHLTPCHALLDAPQPSRPGTIEFLTRIELVAIPIRLPRFHLEAEPSDVKRLRLCACLTGCARPRLLGFGEIKNLPECDATEA